MLIKKLKIFISYKIIVRLLKDQNYLIAINKTKYSKMVEEIAKAERGKISPVFSHLKNLIFLLITFAIILKRSNLKLLKLEIYIK